MGWADNYIKRLQAGEIVQFRPRGNSMSGKLESGQLVTVQPASAVEVSPGDIVLCKVNGRQYLHLVKIKATQRNRPVCMIGNNKGFHNGWTGTIYGVVIKIEE